MLKKKILVAPLNWGLGHATRCIPVINELLSQGFEPVVASDGAALQLMKTEFPKLEHYQLPSYDISYSKSRLFFKAKLLLQAPHIFRTIAAENLLTKKIIDRHNICGIISDNRYGVYSPGTPSVFITHQLNVLSGPATFITSKIQQRIISRFDEIWVPDNEMEPTLSGKMGHLSSTCLRLRYLGLFSRLEKKTCAPEYDLLVLLSGPEPQRQMLENLLYRELEQSRMKILFVRGVVEEGQSSLQKEEFHIYNFLKTEQLQQAMNSSKMVLCRSGYTSLLDLAKIGCRGFLIPTPGQPEQEYLAKRLKKQKIMMSCPQKEFRLEKLKEAEDYSGLVGFPTTNRFTDIFTLFKGK